MLIRKKIMVTLKDLMQDEFLEEGEEITFLGEIGELTKNGEIKYRKELFGDLCGFCKQVNKDLKLGKMNVDKDDVWTQVFLTEKNSDVSLDEIRIDYYRNHIEPSPKSDNVYSVEEGISGFSSEPNPDQKKNSAKKKIWGRTIKNSKIKKEKIFS